MKFILPLSILLFLFQSSYAQESTASSAAFLNYAITQIDNGTYEVTLINKKVVEGTFKKKVHKTYSSKQKHISCTQLDRKSNTLRVIEIENPLNTHVEYVDGKGTFSVKEVFLEEATIFIRIPLEKEATEIMLTMIDPVNKKSIPLITTKI